MDEPAHINRLRVFLVPLGVALAALLLLFKGLSSPPPTPAPPTLTPDPGQEIVAHVGGQGITLAEWAVAFYLDALMSRLSVQPVPTARETLDRLINDVLILTAAAEQGVAVGKDDVEARVAQLEAAWQLTDEQVTAELAAYGLTREVWTEAVARLLTVERYLSDVVWAGVPAEEQATVLADWLQTHRTRTGVEVDTHGLQPALPTPMPVTPSPVAAATLLPVATPTATPVEVSPLPTPSPTATPTAAPIQGSPLPTPDIARTLNVGQVAPDFALTDVNSKTVRLSDYRDQRRVVVAFFRTTG